MTTRKQLDAGHLPALRGSVRRGRTCARRHVDASGHRFVIFVMLLIYRHRSLLLVLVFVTSL